jgi:hypothetical protein
MPGMPGMATPAPTANAGQTYRTYSYQPAPTQPAPTTSFRTYSNRAPAGGFHDAGWKIRGGN